jgi:hypothetical protein
VKEKSYFVDEQLSGPYAFYGTTALLKPRKTVQNDRCSVHALPLGFIWSHHEYIQWLKQTQRYF